MLALVALPASSALECSQFNASSIKIITFDVFAALMNTYPSLLSNVGTMIPQANASVVESIVGDWVGVYGDWFGRVFNASTQQPQPFIWVVRTGLTSILAAHGLANDIPTDSPQFNALCAAWAHLNPWPSTAKVLRQLQSRYKVAALSNGDHDSV